MAIAEVDDRRIHRLIRDLAREQDLRFASCLDVGCGRSRYDRWFDKFQYSKEPRRYIGLDDDPLIREELTAEGVDIRSSAGAGACASDLTLAVEVIEHVLPEDSADFFAFLAASTRKAMALTTPNFEYWHGSNFRQVPDYRECRWVPDHAPIWNPGGGPHTHKHWMTAEHVDELLRGAFPSGEWEHQVFRAWPWVLRDVSVNREFRLHFKLFALVWRTS